MIDLPLVSIVIPTYKRDWELERALKSLLDQTYKNFEIIVIDDNIDTEYSNRVKNIIEEFSVKLDGIDIFLVKNKKKLGASGSRNEGIKISRGSYITFLDDDDIYLPLKIQNQLEKMTLVEADYCIGNISLYFENETISEIKKREFLKSEEANDLLLCHLKYNITGNDTFMFRKEYLLKIGMYEPIEIGDDFYLILKAIINGGRFIYDDNCNVKAYVHKGKKGLSSGEIKIKGEDELYNFKKKYFDTMSKENVRYIKSRHFAVLAFAYLRYYKYFKFLLFGFISFIVDPFQCYKILVERK